jgi:hypothetical protein
LLSSTISLAKMVHSLILSLLIEVEIYYVARHYLAMSSFGDVVIWRCRRRPQPVQVAPGGPSALA